MDKVEKSKTSVFKKGVIDRCVERVKVEIFAFKKKREDEKERMKIKKKNETFICLINKARQDLEQSKNFFANVTDPDLVDYAAHKILANQLFYNYLLKKAKKEKIKAEL